MAQLRFDPFTYQFYCGCRPDEAVWAKAAEFNWDPVRRRYFTEDPFVAVRLVSWADDYATDMLADALGSMRPLQRRETPILLRARIFPGGTDHCASNAIH